MKTMTAALVMMVAFPCWAGPQDKKAAGPIDLIPRAELGDGKAALGWKTIAKGVLAANAEVPNREVVCFDSTPVPEEYDLSLTLERVDARTDDFMVGLVIGEHACTFHFDAYDGGKSFLGLLGLREHSEYAPGGVFKKGKPRAVKVMVRKTTLEIQIDGKKFYKTKPIDWNEASVSDKIHVPSKGKLFLAATSGAWKLSAFTVTSAAAGH